MVVSLCTTIYTSYLLLPTSYLTDLKCFYTDGLNRYSHRMGASGQRRMEE